MRIMPAYVLSGVKSLKNERVCRIRENGECKHAAIVVQICHSIVFSYCKYLFGLPLGILAFFFITATDGHFFKKLCPDILSLLMAEKDC